MNNLFNKITSQILSMCKKLNLNYEKLFAKQIDLFGLQVKRILISRREFRKDSIWSL